MSKSTKSTSSKRKSPTPYSITTRSSAEKTPHEEIQEGDELRFQQLTVSSPKREIDISSPVEYPPLPDEDEEEDNTRLTYIGDSDISEDEDIKLRNLVGEEEDEFMDPMDVEAGSSREGRRRRSPSPDRRTKFPRLGDLGTEAPKETFVGARLGFGVCTNVKVFGGLVGGGNLGKLIFRHINLGKWYQKQTLSDIDVSLNGYYGICIISNFRERSQEEKRRLAIAEAFVPNLPGEYALNEEEARQLFVDIMTVNYRTIVMTEEYLVPLRELRGKKDPITSPLWPTLADGNLQTSTMEDIIPTAINPERLMKLLEVMVEHSLPRFRDRCKSCLVELLIAYAKRGQVTGRWLGKAQMDLEPAIGNAWGSPTVESIRTIWAYFGGYITDANAEEVFTKWESLLPGACIRLLVTLTQAKGSGLTSLDVYVKARRLYKDFPWHLINRLYHDEYLAINKAVKAVGKNAYYGFRRDLGPVRSTLYKDVSWVAKELLIRHGGEGNLANYRGWTPIPKEQVVIEKILADYASTRSTTADVAARITTGEIEDHQHTENIIDQYLDLA